ncbi:MAG: hypothetical protein ABI693_15140 [Bryobacteraceae bacterium]
MQVYRIFRMKDAPRQQFRWAPHTSGVSLLKPRDFEPAGEVEADGVYAAWSALQASPDELRIGDVLENPTAELRIYKYVGFEEAQWVVPEVKSGFDGAPVVAAGSPPSMVPGTV